MHKSIVQARRHSSEDRYRLDISSVSSGLALEYSSVCGCFLLYTPQVGRIRTFLQTTPATAGSAYIEAPMSSEHCCLGANSTVQSPFASEAHDSYILVINEPRKVWICSYALDYALLEVCVFVTSACLLTKRSSDFRPEPAGDDEDRGQKNEMKLHVWSLVESCDEKRLCQEVVRNDFMTLVGFGVWLKVVMRDGCQEVTRNDFMR
jgi:hypothetical protein